MGHDPDREPPFFFMKPATAIVADGKSMAYPALSKDVHHEIEMVVALGKGGSNISADKALEHVWGYGVGLDMTRRDLQGEAKKMGRPWDTGKAFDQSAPCSALVPASQCGHLAKGRIHLKVNGDVRQDGDLAMMIWNVPDTIAYLSTLFTLMPGDLIFSGTPAGVAAVSRGDVLEGHVDGLPTLKTTLV
jgi:fumarylpyruvate hydrolase